MNYMEWCEWFLATRESEERESARERNIEEREERESARARARRY